MRESLDSARRSLLALKPRDLTVGAAASTASGLAAPSPVAGDRPLALPPPVVACCEEPAAPGCPAAEPLPAEPPGAGCAGVETTVTVPLIPLWKSQMYLQVPGLAKLWANCVPAEVV